MHLLQPARRRRQDFLQPRAIGGDGSRPITDMVAKIEAVPRPFADASMARGLQGAHPGGNGQSGISQGSAVVAIAVDQSDFMIVIEIVVTECGIGFPWRHQDAACSANSAMSPGSADFHSIDRPLSGCIQSQLACVQELPVEGRPRGTRLAPRP